MNYDSAWQLLCQYTKTESLRKHALAVSAAMRHYARLSNQAEEYWAITGLLHDSITKCIPTNRIIHTAAGRS
jgi:predicted hydrolase (HD superfamily)